VLRALESTLDNFASELSKSIKFFQTRYQSTPIGGILLAGYASSIPRFGDYVAGKTSIKTESANAWQKVHVSQNDQQQLLPIMHEFATVVGLAQRSNKQ
jgi:Tfp pilus assembly PilM family ATPase